MGDHYLISMSMPDRGMTVHCYLMTNKRGDLDRAYQKLLYEVEKKVGDVTVPLLLSTKLDGYGIEQVREVLAELNPGDNTLREATDFHISIWGMVDTDPRTAELSGLH